jgi:hypothetical protein
MIGAIRHAHDGQNTKMELVYQYLTGPKFRHRVEAIVEKFSEMQQDLDKERKVMTRLWAKREAQIQGVIESTVGMYGDLRASRAKLCRRSTGSSCRCSKVRLNVRRPIQDSGGASKLAILGYVVVAGARLGPLHVLPG